MREAEPLGLTGKNYVWISTQSVIGSMDEDAPVEFPVGMLGVHFPTDRSSLIEEILPALSVVGQALENIVEEGTNMCLDFET